MVWIRRKRKMHFVFEKCSKNKSFHTILFLGLIIFFFNLNYCDLLAVPSYYCVVHLRQEKCTTRTDLHLSLIEYSCRVTSQRSRTYIIVIIILHIINTQAFDIIWPQVVCLMSIEPEIMRCVSHLPAAGIATLNIIIKSTSRKSTQ
jgi:hypothetical protein